MPKKWKQLPSEFGALTKSAVPRFYFMNKRRPLCRRLHGFSDVFENPIAATVYMRTVYQDGDIEVCLVASKTKVSPLKKQSIPRLELLGACMLSKLVDTNCFAFESLLFEVDAYCWVHSLIPSVVLD